MPRKVLRIERALRRMESLLRQASAVKRRTGKIEVEALLTRAVDSVEAIKKAGNTHKRAADKAIIRAYKIYQQMQRLHDEQDFFIGNDRNNRDRVVSLSASSARPVGNFSRVYWDSAALMAVPKQKRGGYDPWWNPPKPSAKYSDLSLSDYWVYNFDETSSENDKYWRNLPSRG
jgi:hypothetical protein